MRTYMGWIGTRWVEATRQNGATRIEDRVELYSSPGGGRASISTIEEADAYAESLEDDDTRQQFWLLLGMAIAGHCDWIGGRCWVDARPQQSWERQMIEQIRCRVADYMQK